MPVQNNSYSDARWFGVDAYHSPGKIAPGFLQAADNCLLDGGDIISRPGRVGLLAAPHADPAYLLGTFRRADGTTAIVYTSGGKLYRLDKGAAVSTEIKDGAGASLALVSKNAFAARLGRYLYIVDGNGPLVRTNLASGTASPFLTAPSVAPSTALTSTPIDALTGGNWAADTLTGPGQVNRVPNADFSQFTSSGGHDTPTGWTAFSGDPDLYGTGHRFAGPTANGQSGAWLLTDNPGEGLLLTTALANDVNANDPARYASGFYAAITLFQSDPSAASTLKMGFLAYADAAGTNLITEIVTEFSVPFSGNNGAVTKDVLFSTAALSIPVLSYRLRLFAGDKNTTGGNSIYSALPVCFPFAAAVATNNSGGMVEVHQPQSLTYIGGRATKSNVGTLGYGKGAGGLHLTRDYGAAQDWSKFNSVALGLGKAAGITGLTLSLAFRQAGSDARYYTNAFTVSADSSVATCDISTVPSAVRAAFRYVEIVLGGDFTVPVANGDDLLLFGPLTGAGNLSIGYADYSWAYTEITDNGDAALADPLESNPSPLSAALTPTLTEAEGKVTIPAKKNAGAGYFAVYRLGGVLGDSRLVAVVLAGADVVSGADARNPYYSWDHAARMLIDNTPDSYVFQPGTFPVSGTPIVYGRDAAPVGAQAIAAYHSRLLLGTGSVLSVSWLLLPGNPSALYFTDAQLPNDPNAAIKGATFPIGGEFDNDPIQALVPHNTDVVIEKHTSKSLLQGYSGENFAVTDYLQGAGFGCIAPRTALLTGNRESCLCASGPFRFDGAAADEFGLLVERLIRPRGFDGAPVISPAQLAGAAAVYHDRRYLLSVPAPDGSGNSLTYVYDTRLEGAASGAGWLRWLFGFTSAATASSGTDSDNLYFGSDDGQIYTLSGSSDMAGPVSAAAQPIPCTVTSRGFMGDFWREDDAQRLYTQIAAPAGTVVNRTVNTDYADRFCTLAAYTLSQAYEQIEDKVFSLTGHWLSVTHSWSSTGPVRLAGFNLTASPRSGDTR